MVFNEGGMYIDLSQIPVILQQIGQNVSAIIAEIRFLNPNAKIYLIGYYNASHLSEELQEKLNPLINALEFSSNITDVTFVPTTSAIDKHPSKYLPNPSDPHLRLHGHKAIAKEIWDVIKFDLDLISQTNE